MNICADCRNPIGTCSWEKSFIPVPGWTAVKTKVLIASPSLRKNREYVESYDVKSCPLFTPPPGWKSQKSRTKPKRIIATNIVTGEEVTYPSIRQAVIKGGFIDISVRRVLAGQAFSHYGYKFRYTKEDGT